VVYNILAVADKLEVVADKLEAGAEQNRLEE